MSRRVTVLGLGAIGLPVAAAVARGEVAGLSLDSVAASSPGRAREKLAQAGITATTIDLAETDRMADLVVECLPPSLFAPVARAVLTSRRTLLAASIGGLLRHPEIIHLAEAGAGRIVIPSGALGGLDAVRAIARHPEATIRLISAKPLSGFEQSAFLDEVGISVSKLVARTCLFEGSAAEGIHHFPKNVNVVAALALAGVGPTRTQLSLWADPELSANTHRVEAKSPISHFTAEIANLPDPANPRTSAITAQSLLAAMTNMTRGYQYA